MKSGTSANTAVILLPLNEKTQSGVLVSAETAEEIGHAITKVPNALGKDLKNQGLLIVNP